MTAADQSTLGVFSALDRASLIKQRNSIVTRYLDLMEQTLTGLILNDAGYLPSYTLDAGMSPDGERRRIGQDWPVNAPTMIGLERLRNLRSCVETVLRDGIPGDFIETGVWRGGSCIFMRAILAAYGIEDRVVWVADSFEGLPPPDMKRYPQDVGDALHQVEYLAVSQQEVEANFRKYGMLDGQVRFIKGFFEYSLPTAPVGTLALIRLDGDMYGSTMDALDGLYHKLSPGGFVIVDDYSLPNCALAVADFRRVHGIRCPIEDIDGSAVLWRKPN